MTEEPMATWNRIRDFKGVRANGVRPRSASRTARRTEPK